jgi:hypothetical protein
MNWKMTDGFLHSKMRRELPGVAAALDALPEFP